MDVAFTGTTVIGMLAGLAAIVPMYYILKRTSAASSAYIWLVVVALVIAGLTAWLVNRVLIAPIKRLSAAMDEVTNGNFDVQLTSGNHIKEIKNIYDKFNIMTKELRSTEILQSDFISNVSHEIKTPITSIEGYAMLLQSEEVSEEDKKEFIGKLLYNTRRLSELAGNVLLLSKIDNQAIETKKKKFRLDEQIRQSILLLEPKWMEKQMEFDVELDSVTYEGNSNLLQHVWNNLIDNAIKFNREGGMIRMRLKEREDTYIFTIEDEGPGVPEEFRKKIFNKFYQADNSHKQDGNGLGLALVKRILDSCGGEIAQENLAPVGCRFTVILRKNEQ